LVPLNVTLEAEVQIEAADIGYIKVGHPVHVKVDAFPYQKHGTIDAKVRTISEDAFRKDTAGNAVPNAFYLSRIALTSPQLTNMKDGSRLLPGMTLSAEIVVGQRSVISYLAWPLTKGLTEAVREP
jgi:hemolysin D